MTRAGAMLTFIAHRDHNLMRRVNRWPAPRWIRCGCCAPPAAAMAGSGMPWAW